MKRLMTLALVFMFCFCAAANAQTRSAYGYVFGLGTATGAIDHITLTDVSSGPTYGFVHWVDGIQWSPAAPSGLRWFKNNLPANHSYFVDVYSNGYGTRGTGFHLSTGSGAYKAPDVRF